MKRKVIILFFIIIPIIIGILLFYETSFVKTDKNQAKELVQINQYFSEPFLFEVYLPANEILIDETTGMPSAARSLIKFIPDNKLIYEKLSSAKDSKTIVIIPMFTAMAYSENGFYDFYSGVCDESCLTVKIKSSLELTHNSSNIGAQVLRLLGYEWTTDVAVHNNPDLLLDYDRIILLHNEYVTQEMFDAITSHPNVIYLYPNALYAKITVDYEKESITLIRGHNYPDSSIKNGFDWEFDNTPDEYDIACSDWQFNQIKNGHMLNCYPENAIVQSMELLEAIKTLGVKT